MDAASARFDEAEQACRRSREALLGAVAAAVPDNAEALAEQAVSPQIDRLREIGRERIDAMRDQLRVEARVLADRVRASVDVVKWPATNLHSTKPEYIREAILPLFDYDTLQSLAEPIRMAGLMTATMPVSGRTFVSLGSLTAALSEVADKTSDLNAAKAALDDAIAANNASDLKELWPTRNTQQP